MDSLMNMKGSDIPYPVQDAMDKIQSAIMTLENTVQQLQAQIAAMPPPLTLQQISQGLSASGSAPLNLTGLPGLPPGP
jgi:hypothetical protein